MVVYDKLFSDIKRMVELYELMKSPRQISIELGYNERFIGYILQYLNVSRKCGWQSVGERNPNWNNPNLQPSPALAYILGIYYGDGSIEKKRFYLRLWVTERKFVESFCQAITDIGLKPHNINSTTKWNKGFSDYTPKKPTTYYFSGIISKALVSWIWDMNYDKIHTFLSTIEMKRQFIRGMYESEGTYSPQSHQIILSNTDKELLSVCQNILIELGFEGSNIILQKPEGNGRKAKYRFYFSRKEQVNRFFNDIRPVIKNNEK